MISWSIESSEWSAPDRVGPGYVAQEVLRLKSQITNLKPKRRSRLSTINSPTINSPTIN